MIDLSISAEDQRTQKICERYWSTTEGNGELEFEGTVKSIAEDYGFSNSMELLERVREQSTARLNTVTCKRCGKQPEVTSRTEASKVYNRKTRKRWGETRQEFVCQECQEAERKEQLERKRQLREKRRRAIREFFRPPVPDYRDPKQWTFQTAIYLLSLVRAGATENLNRIAPLIQQEEPLSPGGLMDHDILDHLTGHEHNLITIHPESDLECFEFEEDKPVTYLKGCVEWHLNLGPRAKANREVIRELEDIFREMDWPDHWIDKTRPLWREVAIYEGLEYLEYKLSEHGLPFEPGERAYGVMENLVQDFSVAQIYCIVYRKVKDASAWQSRTRAPKENATTWALKAIQGFADKARSQNWEVNSYNRDWDCPESMVSKVLYHTVLQVEGFNEVPA
jgi:hypothetical protein